MSILARLESFEITLPLPRPLKMGALYTTERQYVFVRAHDDDGHVGTSYGLARYAPIAATVQRLIAPRWVGQPLDNHPAFYAATVKANVFLGTNGIFWRALSLADCALYELLAQRAGLPLCEYLGGQRRPVPVTLAGVYPTEDETPESLTDLMQRLQDRKPAGIKITSSADYALDTRRIEIARKAIPNGPPFINDVYCMVPSAPAIIPYAREWTQFNMMWLEDPFLFDDFDNLAELSDALDYPVGVGDEQTGLGHFRRLIELGHIRVVRLDPTTCGGLRAFMDIAAMAAEHNVPVSTHIFPFLNAHLACAVPNVKWIEYMLPESGAESIQTLWNSDVEWVDGKILPSDRPGVGYDWNEDLIQDYRNRTG